MLWVISLANWGNAAALDISTADAVRQVVKDYSPIVYFHHDESYYPSNVDYYFNNADLKGAKILEEHEDSYSNFAIINELSRNITADNIMDKKEEIRQELLGNNIAEKDIRFWMQINNTMVKAGNLANTKVYVNIEKSNTNAEMAITYQYFYPYNGPGRVNVCKYSSNCFNLQLSRAGQHEGDWENVTVFINTNNGLVSEVLLSAHGDEKPSINDIKWDGTHPRVYSGKYSHAFYPDTGYQKYKRVFSLNWWLGTASADLFDRTSDSGLSHRINDNDDIVVLGSNIPSSTSFTSPAFTKYTDRWGRYEPLSETIKVYSVSAYTFKEVGAGPNHNFKVIEPSKHGHDDQYDWIPTDNFNQTLETDGHWGIWGQTVRCPAGSYVNGYKLRSESDQGSGDDTALNDVQLHCSTWIRGNPTKWINSAGGSWGSWSYPEYCNESSFVTGFQMLIEPDKGSNTDDTGANSMKLFCQDSDEIQASANTGWGNWTQRYDCGADQAVVGFRARVEAPSGGDDTALNGIRLICEDFNENIISLFKTASQSSTYLDDENVFGAGNAIDGYFDSTKLNHTKLEVQPWWQVDLGATAKIDSIKVYGRTDCCINRLASFYVLVSDTPFGNRTLTELLADHSVWNTYHAGQLTDTFVDFIAGVRGRYVRIQLKGSSYLHMAEVQVTGERIKQNWELITGNLKQISAAPDGSVWGVNYYDNIYRWAGGNWEQITGSLKHVAVGTAGVVWGVDDNDKIYRWNGSAWGEIAGRLKQISVGSDGSVWGVNAADNIYRWNGVAWNRIEGSLKWISVGSASNVWGVDANDEIYRWDGSVFSQIAGQLKRVSMGSDGEVWGVNGNDQVFRWNGNDWDLREGWFEDVSVASTGIVWAVKGNGLIYRLSY